MPGETPVLKVYVSEEYSRNNWRVAGRARQNEDGSISFKLRAQPMLKFQISEQPPRPKKEKYGRQS